MRRVIVSVLSMIILSSTIILGFCVTASAQQSTIIQQETTVSTQTTSERTDDDPFAGDNKPSNLSEKKETPTFYYTLGIMAGLVIVFAVIGFVTSKKKK